MHMKLQRAKPMAQPNVLAFVPNQRVPTSVIHHQLHLHGSLFFGLEDFIWHAWCLHAWLHMIPNGSTWQIKWQVARTMCRIQAFGNQSCCRVSCRTRGLGHHRWIGTWASRANWFGFLLLNQLFRDIFALDLISDVRVRVRTVRIIIWIRPILILIPRIVILSIQSLKWLMQQLNSLIMNSVQCSHESMEGSAIRCASELLCFSDCFLLISSQSPWGRSSRWVIIRFLGTLTVLHYSILHSRKMKVSGSQVAKMMETNPKRKSPPVLKIRVENTTQLLEVLNLSPAIWWETIS